MVLLGEGFVPPGAINWNDFDDNNAFHACNEPPRLDLDDRREPVSATKQFGTRQVRTQGQGKRAFLGSG
jgi:hypothetical protein